MNVTHVYQNMGHPLLGHLPAYTISTSEAEEENSPHFMLDAAKDAPKAPSLPNFVRCKLANLHISITLLKVFETIMDILQ